MFIPLNTWGSQQQCDGEEDVDVKHRMEIAQARFSSLIYILPLYCTAVCSTFSHASEVWGLLESVVKNIN